MSDPDTGPIISNAAGRHQSPWTLRQRLARVLWAVVQCTLFRFSPHNAYGWRAMLLRLFGARLADEVRIRRTVRIEIPWHLNIGQHTAVGDWAILYSLGPITLGRYVTISQYAHLCAGTHESDARAMTLIRPPINLGDDVWIAADAFVGPGVRVGDRTILGARASAFSDLPSDVIAIGNPAKPIKPRRWRGDDAPPGTPPHLIDPPAGAQAPHVHRAVVEA